MKIETLPEGRAAVHSTIELIDGILTWHLLSENARKELTEASNKLEIAEDAMRRAFRDSTK